MIMFVHSSLAGHKDKILTILRAWLAGVFIKAKKGLTLGEVEEQEGGAVQESKIGMAATKRAEKRKLKAPKNGRILGKTVIIVTSQ